MRFFSLPTKIDYFEKVKWMLESHSFQKDDTIITSHSIYDKFLAPYDIKEQCIFPKDYGEGEPTDLVIDQILEKVNRIKPKRIIGIGGGSILDISKLLIFKNETSTEDMFMGKGKLIKDKALILMPTTCGTGSEVTNIAIVELTGLGIKKGLANDVMYPDRAILIPEFLKSLPYEYFIYSSIDAFIHAIESYVSPKANEMTRLLSKEAMALILNGYKDIIQYGQEYRVNLAKTFTLASQYAGIAFGNTGVGAVHALSYPLGGTYHVPHGESNYQFFSQVFKKYNAIKPYGDIKGLNDYLASVLALKEEEDVYVVIENIFEKMIQKKPLKQYGMKREEIKTFTQSVIANQQRLLANNYCILSEKDILEIYTNMYEF